MINNEDLRRQSQKILALIETSERTFDEGDEIRSHIAKYICILCSGFLENCVHILYTEYVKMETSSESVIAHASATLNKIQNPNSEKFRAIAKSFKPEWEPPLNEYLQEEERSAAINYIMRDRHKIAHGKDSDITLARIKQYHLKTVEVIEFLEIQTGLTHLPVEEAVLEDIPVVGLETHEGGGIAVVEEACPTPEEPEIHQSPPEGIHIEKP